MNRIMILRGEGESQPLDKVNFIFDKVIIFTFVMMTQTLNCDHYNRNSCSVLLLLPSEAI